MGFDRLTRMLKEQFSPAERPEHSRDEAIRAATAALLLEVAYADHSLSTDEERRLLDHLKSRFALGDDAVQELVESADELRSQTIDHFELTNLLRKHCTLEERIGIVKEMWRMVYSDGNLHQYENYLVRKLADLLGIEHHVMIEAKLAVSRER